MFEKLSAEYMGLCELLLQCVAVCCSVLQRHLSSELTCDKLSTEYVGLCVPLLQCIVVCCIVP